MMTKVPLFPEISAMGETEPHEMLEHRLYFFIGVMAELKAVISQENALLKSDEGRANFRDPAFIARKQKLCDMYEALAGDIMLAAREGDIRNQTLKHCLIEEMHALRTLMIQNSQQHEMVMHDMQLRVDEVMQRIQAEEATKTQNHKAASSNAPTFTEENTALRQAGITLDNGGNHVTH